MRQCRSKLVCKVSQQKNCCHPAPETALACVTSTIHLPPLPPMQAAPSLRARQKGISRVSDLANHGSNVSFLSCVHLRYHSVPAGCSAMTAQAARNHINVMRLLGQPSRPPGRCQRPNLCSRSDQPPLRQLAVFSSAGVDLHLAHVSAWLSSVHASVLTA